MKKIIAVINQKGGVGKTTTSINLVCGLALEGYKVLLIDLDPQAHSTIGIGIDQKSYKFAIHDVLLKRKELGEVILKSPVDNVDIVPSRIGLDRAEQQLTTEMFKEQRLDKAIKGLEYDFIVIDCRPTLGTLTVNALYTCDFIIVPADMSRYALEGFSDLLDTVDNVKNNKGIEKQDLIRILITKYDTRKTISIEWAMDQLESYKHLLFETKIRQNEALNQAQMAQEPIFSFKSNSAGAEDYKQLTSEFLTSMSDIRKKLAGKKTRLAEPRQAVKDHPADVENFADGSFVHVDVSIIKNNPYQPRQIFDPVSLEELADSIKQKGVLQPIIIRKDENGDVFLVAGERRLESNKDRWFKANSSYFDQGQSD